MKKILAVVLALAMVLGLGSVAFAATERVEVYGDKTVVAGAADVQYTAVAYDAAVAGDPAADTFTWSVTGGTYAATKIDANGKLTVSADEKAGTNLSIVATSVSDDTKASAPFFVTVTAAPATPTLKIDAEPSIEVAVTGKTFGKSTDVFYVTINTKTGSYWLDANNDGKQATDGSEPTLTAVIGAIAVGDIKITDDKGNAYTATAVANNYFSIAPTTPGAYVEGASKLFLTVNYTKVYGTEIKNFAYNETIEKKVDEKPQQEIQDGLDEAVKNKSTIATFEITNLTNQTVSAADWAYITNTWKGTKWYDNFNYLGMTLRFVNSDTNTIFTINASDLDYTWTKPVDFRETTGLVKYDKTEAEMYNVIRAITGDTKNPYTFGFSQMDNTKDRGTSVPKMTISKVVPQQWINYYGHKNVNLFAWDAGISCDNWAHNDPKVLAETTLDATTLTQRIEFTTNDLYKTLVLAAKATTTDAEKPAGDKTDDANPNTGANDIVNVAIVFAVVSLAAAGAFVFKKAK